MSGALAPSVQPTRALGLYAFIFGVAALALLAGVAGLLVVTNGRDEAGAAALAPPEAAAPAQSEVEAPAPSDVGRVIPTSFGVISVNQVLKLLWPTSREPIRARQFGLEAIQVSVTLTNLQRRRLTLSARQFDLRVRATGERVRPATWSLPYHEPRGQWAGKALFRFVVPADASTLTLAYRDPGRRRPLLIDLGRVDSYEGVPVNLVTHSGHGTHP